MNEKYNFVSFFPIISYFSVGKKVNDKSMIWQSVDSCKLSKEQIFSRSNQWISETFKHTLFVKDLEDPVNGILIGKGVSTYYVTKYNVEILLNYTFRIDIKDHKYRITFSNLYTTARSAESWFGITECTKCKEKYTKPHQEEIAKIVQRLYSSLGTKINTTEGW